jgi:hypothetical protein
VSETIHGACLCGQVTFDVHEAEGVIGFCHCTLCQRWSGGAGTASIEVEGTNFEVTAGQELIKHFTQEGRGFAGVGFCSNCGSSLYAYGDGKYYVGAGTLQDLELKPQYHMMVAHKAPWDEIGGDAPQYPEFPPED